MHEIGFYIHLAFMDTVVASHIKETWLVYKVLLVCKYE